MDKLNQELIVESIKDQLDATEKLVMWVVFLIIVIVWNSRKRSGEMEVLQLKLKRQDAIIVLTWVYAFSSLGVVVFLLRIHELLRFTTGKNFNDAILILFTHSWLLNPFAYFGGDIAARVASACGFALWIIIWQACMQSLFDLRDGISKEEAVKLKLPLHIFVVASGLTILTIIFIYITLVIRLFTVDVELGKSLLWNGVILIIVTPIAWLLGRKIFSLWDRKTAA